MYSQCEQIRFYLNQKTNCIEIQKKIAIVR